MHHTPSIHVHAMRVCAASLTPNAICVSGDGKPGQQPRAGHGGAGAGRRQGGRPFDRSRKATRTGPFKSHWDLHHWSFGGPDSVRHENGPGRREPPAEANFRPPKGRPAVTDASRLRAPCSHAPSVPTQPQTRTPILKGPHPHTRYVCAVIKGGGASRTLRAICVCGRERVGRASDGREGDRLTGATRQQRRDLSSPMGTCTT